ncbi:hypothetical protein [Stenotrophomonas indicatrix]|uniref:hypothetical protein n=1 Tax=Stenotrophomonas indicatrix TaxID=2045451 RepID=UPI001CBF90F8|nr:hypothetical protein [Stenotrophomonas indicatrix]
MDLDAAVWSGMVGGSIATLIARRAAERLPSHYRGRSLAYLRRRHRVAVWSANALFLLGIAGSLLIWPLGHYAHTDSRPLLLGMGISCGSALLALVLVSWVLRRPMREALVTYGYAQGGPVWLVYSIMLAGVAAGVVGLVQVLR